MDVFYDYIQHIHYFYFRVHSEEARGRERGREGKCEISLVGILTPRIVNISRELHK